jgi:group I intron endonuclease
MLIYKATSKTSGKSYIGKTTNTLKQRVGEHIRKSKKSKHTNHFHNAIKKYGKDDFVWEILDTCDSEEELNILEVKHIKSHNTYSDGYNLSLGGEGQTGYKYTNEHSKKMSDSLKKAYREGRKKSVFETMSDESINKIREGASKWAKENTVGNKNGMWGKGKKIKIDNKIYNNMREAAEDLNVHKKTIQYRLNSDNFKNYERL